MYQDLHFTESNINNLILEPDVQFEDCKFSGLNFSDYNFRSTSFMNCKFINCNLANQDFLNVSMRDVQFELCNLIGVNWCNLKRLENQEFCNCKLNFSVFQGLKLKKIKIVDCSALDVDFSDSDLTESIFTGSLLEGAIFNRATLINSDFRSAKNYLFDLRTTKVKGLKLRLPEAMNLFSALGVNVEY